MTAVTGHYVSTAPRFLIDFYEDVVNNPATFEGDDIDVDLLRRMLTYPAMSEAWKELAKPKYADRLRGQEDRLDPPSMPCNRDEWDDTPFDLVANTVHMAVENVMRHPPWELKRSDVRGYFENIAKAARAFSDAVKGSPLDIDSHRFFPAPSLFALLKVFRKECWEYGGDQFAEAMRRDDDLRLKCKNGMSFWEDDGRDWPFHVRRLPEERKIDLEHCSIEGLQYWFKASFQYGMPRMSVLAGAVADAAENEAQRASGDPSHILPKPGDAKARRMYVIRYLAMWFNYWFGAYLRGTLARIVSTALDDPDIGPEQIDEATRGWKPPPRPWSHSPFERQRY